MKEIMITARSFLEIMYPKCIWFEEVFKYYEIATDAEIKEFEKLLRDDKEPEALNLIKKVLGIQ